MKKGDLLVEGIMEGVYFDDRLVHAEADIFGEICYIKERTESLVQNEKIKTGNEENKCEICINNFKINLNKGVSKFEKSDTITTNKKVKFFSNIYLPIELKKYTNLEYEIQEKEYTEETLKEKLLNVLEEEFENEYEISKYEEKDKKRKEKHPENKSKKTKGRQSKFSSKYQERIKSIKESDRKIKEAEKQAKSAKKEKTKEEKMNETYKRMAEFRTVAAANYAGRMNEVNDKVNNFYLDPKPPKEFN